MPKLKHFVCLLISCFFLTGCFEVIEEITYQDQESGTYLLTVNCSKSKTRLNALIKMDTFMGLNIPKEYEISGELSKAQQTIKAIPGISATNYTLDFTNYIATFTFKFDKTATLNKALNAVAQSQSGKKKIPYHDVYLYSSNVFQRLQVPSDSLSKTLNYKKEQMKLIGGAKATSIYRFAQPVLKASNAKAVISKNRKAVMLQKDITDIIANPSIFTNTITF